MKQSDPFGFDYHMGGEAAASPELVSAIAHIFNNSFGLRPDGTPYKLGPKTTQKRLADTHHVFTARHPAAGRCGYLYGRVINSKNGKIGWIDSLAVLPAHRRKRVATRLVGRFIAKIADCKWVGCATPNPIAALVITKAAKGKAYVGECNPSAALKSMIDEIRSQCPDLTGAAINFKKLLVRTTFTPSGEESKEWSPPHPSEPPPWWSLLEHLPAQYEALLIVDRSRKVRT